MAQGLKPASSRVGEAALLCSFFYLDGFLRFRGELTYRDWALDSGAFSAHTSGAKIDNLEFIERALELQASDEKLVEVYALDVIGDWKASIRNCEQAWERGLRAIPCYHSGEPESVLLALARDYPKIAIGGAVGMNRIRKMEWASQCFSRVWPKKIHGFGFGTEKQLNALPWHSIDATNWAVGPLKYGYWRAFGKLGVRGVENQNLWAEVEHYLRVERVAQTRWRVEMQRLAA